MKILLSGGGTGGHIYPAIALAQEARRLFSDVEILYMGGRERMESQIVPEAGIPFVGVTVKSLKKVVSVGAIGTAWSLFRGFLEARAELKKWRPDVAIGTGGYVAGASMMAAVSLRIPSIILAPDAAPGRTNRLVGKFAKQICLWLGDVDGSFPQGKTVRTGLPVRPEIRSGLSQSECRLKLGLEADRFTVLVIGGSQGAQRLNEIVIEALTELGDDVQVLHQTGPKNFEDVQSQVGKVGELKVSHVPMGYMDADQTPMAYRAADIIVCRSGVSTLAEATVNELPLLMVPLPTAYADHQTLNAKSIENSGAGIYLNQKTLTGQGLAEHIVSLKSNLAQYESMKAASLSVGRPEAARDILQIAMGLATK
ncbi:MAG: undecaprenyldiphospho-muramoylpentapeptide beta-N-acetylglucosaminyltransferase [Chthonomonadales bacterium]